MGDINELKKERNKTMANLPGSIKNLNTLLGEQLLEGGGSGGGGSSDFSTAEVTVVNRIDGTLFFFLPFLDSSDNLALVGVSGEVGEYDTKTYDAILAAGGCDFVMGPSFNGSLAVTGDAQDFGYKVAITGDCTITINQAE